MDNLRQFLKEDPNFTLWEYLKTSAKPIMIYGMGDGAEKIIAVLDKKEIPFCEIFASDGFVRGHSFHGKRVKSFLEIKEEYKEFVILVAFASKQTETVEMLYKLSSQYELYAPDVNVSGDYTEVFDSEYYKKHCDELFEAMNMFELCDRDIFCRILDFKISGRLEYLREADSLVKVPQCRFDSSLVKHYVDLGAYNGDTLRQAVELYPNLCDAVLFEPDEKNFKKLCTYAETLDIQTHPYNNAAWNEQSQMTIHMGFGKNSTLGSIGEGMQKKKDKIINTLPPDDAAQIADLIKYDVEGSEYEAIEGSQRLITQCRPVLIVSLYHNNNDLYRLPRLIKSYAPYKLYLHRKPCLPAWETEIVAVDEKYTVQGEENV